MFLSVVASVAALAAAPAAIPSTPVHSAGISHGAQAYTTRYHAQPSISLHQVESRFANRNAVPVCRWQADVTVNRAVEAQGRPVVSLSKSVHRFAPLSGSHAGGCEAARSQIEAEVARYAQAKVADAQAVAVRDSAALPAELDSLRELNVQGG